MFLPTELGPAKEDKMVVSVIRRLGSYAAGVALALLGGVLIVMGLAGIAGWLLALT